jgi:hypothetical protein
LFSVCGEPVAVSFLEAFKFVGHASSCSERETNHAKNLVWGRNVPACHGDLLGAEAGNIRANGTLPVSRERGNVYV